MHRNTLTSWLGRGCPALERADRASGKEWKLSLPDIIEWRIDTAVDDAVSGLLSPDGQISKDEADRRKAVANARLAEIEVDEKLRSVVLVSDATAAMADFCQALRAGLSNGAVKSAGRTAAMTNPNEIREFFESEINRSMEVAQSSLREQWHEIRDGKPADLDDGPADTE